MSLNYYEHDYATECRAEQIYIDDTDPGRYVVQMAPVVTYKGFLTMMVGDEVVGTMDATFDYSNIPEHRRQTALNWIIQRATLLRIGWQ